MQGLFSNVVSVDVPFKCIAEVGAKKFKWESNGYDFFSNVCGGFGKKVVPKIYNESVF